MVPYLLSRGSGPVDSPRQRTREIHAILSRDAEKTLPSCGAAQCARPNIVADVARCGSLPRPGPATPFVGFPGHDLAALWTTTILRCDNPTSHLLRSPAPFGSRGMRLRLYHRALAINRVLPVSRARNPQQCTLSASSKYFHSVNPFNHAMSICFVSGVNNDQGPTLLWVCTC